MTTTYHKNTTHLSTSTKGWPADGLSGCIQKPAASKGELHEIQDEKFFRFNLGVLTDNVCIFEQIF